MNSKLDLKVAEALGSPSFRMKEIGGGDLNDAYRIELADGRIVFMKTHPETGAEVFAAEARGLAWIDVEDGPRVPEVLATSDESKLDGEPGFLVLEWIETGPRPLDFGERFGRELAALHACGASRFGHEEDNFLGRLRQSNEGCSDWATFYGEQRITPLWRRAQERKLSSPKLDKSLERVLSKLSELVGPPEAPARLHGDLWSGNVMCDDAGRPVIFDPAVYGGHREVDLAMLRLFGFSHDRVFDAYDERFPLAEGAAGRVPLHQLYPLLVHLNLFGRSYLGGCETAARLASEG